MVRIIFMGTPEIAVPTLEALNNCFGIAAVVTAPDKPKGRGMHLTASPVKQKAQELNIELLQPDDLNDIDFIDRLKQISPDLIVVFAFRFLPKDVYTLSKIASFNIHTSLLPDYRGAAPIN
jgi:methionyl-tRNA formyltransferase